MARRRAGSKNPKDIMIQDSIGVSVIFPLPEEQRKFTLEVPKMLTVKEIIASSGILEWYPQIDLSFHKVGIYGKVVSLDQGVSDGDRIEIYRPITADPKAVRRQKAESPSAASSDITSKENAC